MGLLQDLLKEVPLSSVLKERVALAEEKFERASKEIESYKQRVAALERENEMLRAQIPSKPPRTLDGDTARVLVGLFKAAEMEDRDVGAMARELVMERGVLQYHLDRLQEAGLADVTGANYLHEHIYWGLTPKGRQYVVEEKLI
jgi:DNA-binding MarR family transcriptional regulator